MNFKNIKRINTLFDSLTLEDRSIVISELSSKMLPKRVKAGELVKVIVNNIPRWAICLSGGNQLKVWLYQDRRTTFNYVYWYKLIYQTNELYELEDCSDKYKIIKTEEISNLSKRIILHKLPLDKKFIVVSYKSLFGFIIKEIKNEGYLIYFEDDSIKLLKSNQIKFYKAE